MLVLYTTAFEAVSIPENMRGDRLLMSLQGEPYHYYGCMEVVYFLLLGHQVHSAKREGCRPDGATSCNLSFRNILRQSGFPLF